MKTVTFNIRCDYNQDAENSFSYRKPLIIEKLFKENPDIICFQEVRPHVARWLNEILTDYNLLGCGRDEKLEDEQVTIALKKDKFQIISYQTKWLSDTPEIPGSRYKEQSICPRSYAEVIVEEIETKEIFRIINTHLDHEEKMARVKSSEQILNHLKNITFFKDAHILIFGDFNAEPMDKEIKMFTDGTGLIDFTSNIKETYHEYNKIEKCIKIDYIFGSENLICKKSGAWEDKKNAVYLSDHYPVFAEITTK